MLSVCLLACGDDGSEPDGAAGAPFAGVSGSVGSAGNSGGAAGVGSAGTAVAQAGAQAIAGRMGGAGATGSSGASGSSAAGRSGASGGRSGGGQGAGQGGAAGSAAGAGGSGTLEGNFSFFVTSLVAMRRLSGSQDGFGGDLGGLAGADEICQMIAAGEGAGNKTWRAFLSATTGGANGGPVHAIDRIGEGPWYDRRGRLFAMNKAGLLMDRPDGDDMVAANLPDEKGEPLMQNDADDHDVLTGSNRQGRLNEMDQGSTCDDWTSAIGSTGRPMCGHAWPARSGMNWMQAHNCPGCAPGVNLVQSGGGMGTDTVGGGGGYGAIYCFALQP
jgi:hypothetical protein